MFDNETGVGRLGTHEVYATTDLGPSDVVRQLLAPSAMFTADDTPQRNFIATKID
jgi:hypothetical protein